MFFRYGNAQQFLLTNLPIVEVDPRLPEVVDPATGKSFIPSTFESVKYLPLDLRTILRQMLPDMYFCAVELAEVATENGLFGQRVPTDELDQFPMLGAILSLAVKQMMDKDFVDESTIRTSIKYFLMDELLNSEQKAVFRNESREIMNKLDLWEIRLFEETGWRGCKKTENALKLMYDSKQSSFGHSKKSCTQQSTKKYTSRSSPPYPANLCCDMTILGNDGQLYTSVASKTGVCRWVRRKDPFYHVTVTMRASSSLVPITSAALAKHLKKYFDWQEISQLVDYNQKDLMQNVKLKGTILTFDVPKSISNDLPFIVNKARLKKHILRHSLADSSWEAGTSNFFLMLDEKSPHHRELATIMPGEVVVN